MELKKFDFKNIINGVTKGSIAEECNIEPGDILVSINGQKIEDTIEYQFMESDEYIELEIQHKNGENVIYEIEKEYDEELGLEFSNPIIDSVKSCNNKCIFCFIDQLPKGMRETLYLKDDDSRLSFLQGNFITMTNMKDSDIEKMIKYRISPVNISVHTTNPELRVKMLNNKNAGDILYKIQKLNDAGISMNGQIVCVPDCNDEEELEKTIMDLSRFSPNMHSIAVVPIGLTKHRENLAKVKIFEKENASKLIDQIELMQNKFRDLLGTNFVYASDEFYVIAQRELPEYDKYEEFSQIENGVGLIRKFEKEIMDELSNLPRKNSTKKIHITIATGVSAYEFMKGISKLVVEKIPELIIDVHKINNDFFGKTITVAGLITGNDIINQLGEKKIGDYLFLPRVMFRSDEMVFLDDLTLEELSEKLNVPVIVCEVEGKDFVEKIIEVVDR